MGFRRWILKIHLYGGLLCFWYLIIFAISSLHFHHDFDFMKEKQISYESIPVTLVHDSESSDSARATSLQNALGLAGWYLYWETYTDSLGNFHTEVQNPKTTYRIVYDPVSSTASITSEYKGFWSILNALHGFAGRMPNAPLVIFWYIFTYICLTVVVFSIVSGIWLWSGKREGKSLGWATLLATIAFSVLLMLIVYLKG